MNNIDNEIDKNEISDYQESIKVQKKKKSTAFNHIWWIPFIALLRPKVLWSLSDLIMPAVSKLEKRK